MKIKEQVSNSNIKTMIITAYVKDVLFKDYPYLQELIK
jgi:hypothetical protein